MSADQAVQMEAGGVDTIGADLAAIRPAPRISIQAFCETPEAAHAMQHVFADRRMLRTHSKVHMGGITAAVDFYGSAPTPNLIILESTKTGADLLSGLDRLADVCDPGSRVIVLGHQNDVNLYRELIRRGISEYSVVPFEVLDMIRTIGGLYNEEGAPALGRTIAFVGAKGGVGASTIAHNVGWSIARQFKNDVVIADMDLPFGTAGLDYNIDPTQGIAEAVLAPERIDDALIDRLLAKCSEHLNLLAAPATLDQTYDFGEEDFDVLIETIQSNVPAIVLDVPHVWTSWSKKALIAADEVVVVAAPDLANLRNAKNIFDHLANERPNDAEARLVLNQVGVPKRPEIKVADIAKALEIEPEAVIPFEPSLFGLASNNGQMLLETDAKSESGKSLEQLAAVLVGKPEVNAKSKGGALASFFSKLRHG